MTSIMERLQANAHLLNDFVNKGRADVLYENEVVRTVGNVILNYLFGNVPCTCEDQSSSACGKKLLKFQQDPVLIKIVSRRMSIKDIRRLIILHASTVKQVLRHSLQKTRKDPKYCCHN